VYSPAGDGPPEWLKKGLDPALQGASDNQARMHWIVETVRHYLLAWGYWAIVAGLLGENAGLPLPGETIMAFASFMAFRQHHLSFAWIIVVGTISATAGDNIGYLLGRSLGRRLLGKWKRLFRLDDEDIQAGEELVRRHGPLTVFVARFIFGLRTITGPLAGILRMHWKRFVLWNALGTVFWVSAMVLMGYAFGHAFDTLLGFFEKADIAIMAAIIGLGIFFWKRYKKKKAAKRKNRRLPQAA
jgi:membrane protein DedA with SNARE-associated domain